METTAPMNKKLPKLHILGFGVGSIPINMSFAIVVLYLAYFYTDVFLLPPAIMGILFIGLPVVIRALISVAMLFFNLSESRMAEIITELNRAKA